MICSRRSFLKTSGLLASGAVLGGMPFISSCASPSRETMPFGLQLWTLRDIIFDDPQGTLRQVAEFGYKQIESFEGPEGIFWGMGNRNFKSFLDDIGLTMISSHTDVFQDFERKADEAAEIGVEYLVCPWIGPQDSLDDYRTMADRFNEIGEKANAAGIKFAYHNHAYTFEEMDGVLPQELLMDNTDPELVEYQMDIYWVVAANADPVEWLNRYPGRFTSSHVKDLSNGDEPESTLLGTGVIDFPTVLSAAKEQGMKYFIVEQEQYTDTTPLDAIQENARFMKELRI
jgi:sugar phosphate isomerase/epimerase